MLIKIWTVILTLFTIYGAYLSFANKLIPYPEGTKVSLREDSVTGRRPSFFYGVYSRTRTPSGGGFGYGK
ncbi:MAG: hypothetical protein H7A23_15855 [Leptospiraceae bacterium]|nr:hypothetical protein [Leptospiraceae bacterium]MCP5496024.1 hypothetical protein [Leptospiraceae bacterium]